MKAPKTDRIVIFSDIHIHNYKTFSKDYGQDRLKICLDILFAVYEYAATIDAKTVLFCGDMFDSAGLLPTSVVIETVRTYQKINHQFPDIRTYAIGGNHDHAAKNTLDKPAPCALQLLDAVLTNFHTIEDSWVEGENYHVYGIPYYQNPKDFEYGLKGMSSQTVTQILLTHQTPIGAIQGLDTGDFDPDSSIFDACDFVFNGHIHTRTKHNDKVYTVGSTHHRDLGDCGKVKGIHVLDLETKQVEFVSLDPHYPSITKVYTEEEAGIVRSHGDWPVMQFETKKPKTDDDAAQIQTDFDAGNDKAEILRAYWEQEDGNDKALLETGLKLV